LKRNPGPTEQATATRVFGLLYLCKGVPNENQTSSPAASRWPVLSQTVNQNFVVAIGGLLELYRHRLQVRFTVTVCGCGAIRMSRLQLKLFRYPNFDKMVIKVKKNIVIVSKFWFCFNKRKYNTTTSSIPKLL